MAEIKTEPVDVTILMPCLDEANSLPECIEMAQEALATLAEKGLSGEILISDNGSTDGSQQMARERGCRVVDAPERGYGAALIFGCENAAGRFIVMGDSDASYDFRECVPMIDKLVEGHDLCMGNRFKGKIHPGAMPWKNRMIGNPILSGILNLFYRSGLGDAHCGLRAFTRGAFDRMKLNSTGMEFASEMVVKAALLGLKRTEVPASLRPDKRGRPPHLRPWRDGWRHLRFLLILSPLWAYFIPSMFLLLGSSFIVIGMLATPPGEMLQIGPVEFGDHWMILAGGLFGVGASGFMLGVVAFLYAIQSGFRRLTPSARHLARIFTVNNTLLAGLFFIILGLGVLAYVVIFWGKSGFGGLAMTREMVASTLCIGTGLKLIFWGFLISLVVVDTARFSAGKEHPQP